MCISGGVVLALTALVVLAEVMTDDGAAEPPGSPAALRPTPLEVVFGVAAPLFYFSVLTVLIAVVMTVRARAAEKSTLF